MENPMRNLKIMLVTVLLFLTPNIYGFFFKTAPPSKSQTPSPLSSSVNAIVLRSAIFVKSAADIEEFVNAVSSKDTQHLDFMIYKGKAFVVEKNTKVTCAESNKYYGVVFITFREGKYQNQSGYTLSPVVIADR